jgi:hypothetical protein
MKPSSNLLPLQDSNLLKWAPVAHACNILVTQEAEIKRILVQIQPEQRVRDHLKNTHYKKMAGGVAQAPEFKPQ